MIEKYIKGDCHKVLKKFETNSVDLVYSSPPYGITAAEWDNALDWKMLFPELFRVLKPKGILILHCSMPFTYTLLQHATPKYHYVWIKNKITNFYKAKYQPLRKHEEIMVYYKKAGTYNPQMVGDQVIPTFNTQPSGQSYYNYTKKQNPVEKTTHTGRYPTTILEYPIRKEKTGITRNDDLMDYFIKTYSNENDTVLDFTCHNDNSGSRCNVLKRNFIGVDIHFKDNFPKEIEIFKEEIK